MGLKLSAALLAAILPFTACSYGVKTEHDKHHR
jgi:hypothetical protein